MVEFSTPVHGFLVVQPLFNKFESLSTFESHQDWESSTWIIKMHIQDFGNISSLVIFRLSSCDSSPPLRLVVGGSSKVHKMSYTHPNSILSISMSYMRQEEEVGKNPFWYFWVDWPWPFNFQLKIFKFKYLGFCSSDWKTEDSSEKLEIKRIYGEKTIWYFECFTFIGPCDSSTSPRANFWPGTLEKFSKHGFSFFTQIYHFLLNPDPSDILVA